MADWSPEAALRLDRAGVPRPDGTPLGDAAHVLGVLAADEDDRVVFVATRDIYARGETTGLSLGDLRALVRSARRWDALSSDVRNDR